MSSPGSSRSSPEAEWSNVGFDVGAWSIWYLDVGLAVGQVGAEAVVAECLELAPAAKVLFSTDGYRLPELYLVGAAQLRAALGRVLDRRVGAGNARRLYGLATS